MANTFKPEYPISRETLYELAWSQPMTSIAKMFDVSSSYLARLYTKLEVPKPAPGYWAKVAAGKTVTKPELPDPKPSTLLEWDRYNDAPINERPAPKPPKKRPQHLPVPKLGRPKAHPLISGAKAHFLKTRHSDIGYLRPFKKNLVDLIISTEQLDKALNIANDLFSIFEDYGYEVTLATANSHLFNRPSVDEREKPKNTNRLDNHWSPGRNTVVYVGTVAIGITLFEYSEELEAESEYKNGDRIWTKKTSKSKNHWGRNWTLTHDFPTGRFCLRAYSPYSGTTWAHEWDIEKDQDISKLGHDIAKELTDHASTISELVKKAERAAEIRRKEWEEKELKWKLEQEKREQKEARDQSLKELRQLIDKWGEVKRIDSFFDEIEKVSVDLPQHTRTAVLERVQLAKDVIGKADAFQELLNWQTPDEILDNKRNREANWFLKPPLPEH